MRRADFDPTAPLVLVDDRAVRAGARVPAVPDACGTEALFGDEVAVRRPVRRPRAQQGEPQSDALFDLP
ncbi:hypothetical protein [Streptomyces sp. PBH53]|uniref:hypothetical protein n=1 Tax=Streptomyces sp. PBH53 TaxID=1577075 RepID=UPI001AD80313|nr:hypothetical protein [Streptomyces sp. PBH53]